MGQMNEIKNVQIVYFSGTGGTKRIADSFEKELTKREVKVEVRNLGSKDMAEPASEKLSDGIDLCILLYPVYAFDAPKPVYHWIEGIGKQDGEKRIAVISVSGGGEVWPNTGCRNNCCSKLEEKGFKIVHDAMMCMPANILTEVSDHLAMRLIRIIPEKVGRILDDILANKIVRTHFHKSALRNFITNLEDKNTNKFAQGLIITEACKGCGWCAKNCPMANIVMDESSSKPKFLESCTVCMRCIYGCPFHAIQAKSSVVFKNGFDLEAVEKRMEGVELEPIEKCCKGIMFKGVKDYLRETH